MLRENEIGMDEEPPQFSSLPDGKIHKLLTILERDFSILIFDRSNNEQIQNSHASDELRLEGFFMNILLCLTPKKQTMYVYQNHSLRQVLEKFERHGYTAVPVIDEEGKYIGIISEGDLLRELKQNLFTDMREMQKVSVMNITRKLHYDPVTINTSMDDLVQKAMSQNFVPVVDDRDVFIGIVTRREIINYCYQQPREKASSPTVTQPTQPHPLAKKVMA